MFEKAKEWGRILIPDFLMGVVAAVAGAKIAQEGNNTNTAKTLGVEIGKILSVDRGEFLHELRVINARTQGGLEVLIKLFDKLEKGNGLIKVRSRWYREEWITRKLLVIPPKYRSSEYPWLNDLLEQNPVEFFAKLELLNNDGWLQMLRQTKETTKDSFGKINNKINNSQTMINIDNKLNCIADKWEKKAQRQKKGGMRTWIDFLR